MAYGNERVSSAGAAGRRAPTLRRVGEVEPSNQERRLCHREEQNGSNMGKEPVPKPNTGGGGGPRRSHVA